MKQVLVLVMIMVLIGCGSLKKQPETVKLEFRFAEIWPTEGLEEVTVTAWGETQTYYLHDEIEMTNADIDSAFVTTWNDSPVVELIFTESGRERFARLTEENIGKRLGMLVDGELVIAPVIRDAILTGKALINGDFSEKEAQRIADGIVLK